MGLSRTAISPRPGERQFYPDIGGNAATDAEAMLQHAFTPARKLNPRSVLVDGNSPQQLVEINPERLGVYVRNRHASMTLWIGDQGVGNDGLSGWPVPPGETEKFTAGEFYGALYGIYDAGAAKTAVFVLEPGS